MQDSSGILHGSAAMVSDPRTMAVAREASPLGPLLNSGSNFIGAAIHTSPDVSLSDDSLGLTPPEPTRARQARGRSGSAGGIVKTRLSLGLRRAASSGTRRANGVPRLPSPSITQSRVPVPVVKALVKVS